MKGMFTLKETYSTMVGITTYQEEWLWWKIWTRSLWPKVSCFLGLVGRKNLLIWDQIRKKGYQDRSYCYICGNQKDDMEHILNTCSYAKAVWEHISSIFSYSNHNPNNQMATFEQWRNILLKNIVVNIA